MADTEQFLVDEAATVAAGRRLGGALAAAGTAVIYLEGNLGAGKTTFTRGVLQGFGHTGAVKSPTYTLVEPYEFDTQRRVYHFDLYRLGDPEELEYMGIRDYFTDGSVCLVEWPARGAGVLPGADLVVILALAGVEQGPPGRQLQLQACSSRGRAILEQIECEGD